MRVQCINKVTKYFDCKENLKQKRWYTVCTVKIEMQFTVFAFTSSQCTFKKQEELRKKKEKEARRKREEENRRRQEEEAIGRQEDRIDNVNVGGQFNDTISETDDVGIHAASSSPHNTTPFTDDVSVDTLPPTYHDVENQNRRMEQKRW